MPIIAAAAARFVAEPIRLAAAGPAGTCIPMMRIAILAAMPAQAGKTAVRGYAGITPAMSIIVMDVLFLVRERMQAAVIAHVLIMIRVSFIAVTAARLAV
jgi:hypothetical protein